MLICSCQRVDLLPVFISCQALTAEHTINVRCFRYFSSADRQVSCQNSSHHLIHVRIEVAVVVVGEGDGWECVSLTFISTHIKIGIWFTRQFYTCFFLTLAGLVQEGHSRARNSHWLFLSFPNYKKDKGAEFWTVAHYIWRLDINPVSNDFDTNQPPFPTLNVKRLQTFFRTGHMPLVICTETQRGTH